MTDPNWTAVDDYVANHLLEADDALTSALAHNAANNLPPIDVSPAQGKMLMLLAQMAGARRILEIGTLGGYSTIWLARALPDGGQLLTLEVDKRHASVARENIEGAGLAGKVDIIIGPAQASLAAMQDVEPFDFVFIDADKQGNVHYVTEALRLCRKGATIIVDNVIRDGGVTDAASNDARIIGTRRLYEFVSAHPQLDATAVQTIGAKGWDGFMLIRVA
jgi:predicted O-methyltransferase YrrM